MPTQQQRDLQKSCPHQNWLDINLSECDFYVRRSSINPLDGHEPQPIQGEERIFRRPSPALHRAYTLAKEYKDQGYDVLRDIQPGVHRITKPGEAPFYVFVAFVDRTKGKHVGNKQSLNGNHIATPQSEYVSQMVRVEKRAHKVLKAIAERNDQSVGELLEEMVASALDGKNVFDPGMMHHVNQLKSLYGIDENEGE